MTGALARIPSPSGWLWDKYSPRLCEVCGILVDGFTRRTRCDCGKLGCDKTCARRCGEHGHNGIHGDSYTLDLCKVCKRITEHADGECIYGLDNVYPHNTELYAIPGRLRLRSDPILARRLTS